MFEGNSASLEDVKCTEIINPTPYWEVMTIGGENVRTQEPGICGNGLCEDNVGETHENCPRDCVESRDMRPRSISPEEGLQLDELQNMLLYLVIVIVAAAGMLVFLKFKTRAVRKK